MSRTLLGELQAECRGQLNRRRIYRARAEWRRLICDSGTLRGRRVVWAWISASVRAALYMSALVVQFDGTL